MLIDAGGSRGARRDARRNYRATASYERSRSAHLFFERTDSAVEICPQHSRSPLHSFKTRNAGRECVTLLQLAR